jgi:hypothetical protein
MKEGANLDVLVRRFKALPQDKPILRHAHGCWFCGYPELTPDRATGFGKTPDAAYKAWGLKIKQKNRAAKEAMYLSLVRDGWVIDMPVPMAYQKPQEKPRSGFRALLARVFG